MDGGSPGCTGRCSAACQLVAHSLVQLAPPCPFSSRSRQARNLAPLGPPNPSHLLFSSSASEGSSTSSHLEWGVIDSRPEPRRQKKWGSAERWLAPKRKYELHGADSLGTQPAAAPNKLGVTVTTYTCKMYLFSHPEAHSEAMSPRRYLAVLDQALGGVFARAEPQSWLPSTFSHRSRLTIANTLLHAVGLTFISGSLALPSLFPLSGASLVHPKPLIPAFVSSVVCIVHHAKKIHSCHRKPEKHQVPQKKMQQPRNTQSRKHRYPSPPR